MRKMEYKDILYETRGSAVWITINRPDKYNAFRGVTCEELIHAINRAGWDKSVAAIVLTGAGSGEISEGTAAFSPEIFRLRSARRVLRSYDTVPYCFGF